MGGHYNFCCVEIAEGREYKLKTEKNGGPEAGRGGAVPAAPGRSPLQENALKIEGYGPARTRLDNFSEIQGV
jgi:hypothetical protein